MRLPWISRKDHARKYARVLREAREIAESAHRTADARVADAHKQLELCNRERADLQLKLLRVGFGINPFYEVVEQQQSSSILPEQPQETPYAFGAGTNASPDEVQATFVKEAMDKYPGNMRQIQRHVQMRLAQYYAESGRQQPAPISAADLAQARRVAADIDAAIAEGRANAAKE